MDWVIGGLIVAVGLVAHAHTQRTIRKMKLEEQERELIAKGWRWQTMRGIPGWPQVLTPPPPPVRSAKTVATRDGG